MESKKRGNLKIVGKVGAGKQGDEVYDPAGLSPTIRDAGGQGRGCFVSVSDSQRSTNTQPQSINTTTSTTKPFETLSRSTPDLFQISISSAVDSLAKRFQSLVKEVDLKILEGLFSLRSQGFFPLRDLNFCSWKTSKDFSATIMGEPLELSSQPFLTWGTFSNGRYLTARILESPKTEKGCSLSDILEESVNPKYFLSQAVTERLMSYKDNQLQTVSKPDTKPSEMDRMLLKVNSMHKKQSTEEIKRTLMGITPSQ